MAIIRGTAGDDVQTGTAGDDRILASAGADTIDGLGGFDTIDYRTASAGIIVSTSFEDSLIFDGFGASDRVIGGVEGILGTSFRDVIEGNALDNQFFGFDGDDDLRGDSGDDRLDGGRGNDTLDGGAGSDTLLGRSGADVLIGGGGGDSMLGGDGDDILTANEIDEPVLMRGNAGNDSIFFHGAVDSSVLEVTGDDGDDLAVIVNEDGGGLSGGRGDDVLSLSSLAGQGAVRGGPGDDTISVELELGAIRGDAGDDRISGSVDEGTVDGGSGNDEISLKGGGLFLDLLGGAGNDVLINATPAGEVEDLTLNGGRGDDILRGGAGPDTFQFSLNDRGADTVENFVAGEDSLEFDHTGLQFDDVDTNDSGSLDAGDDAVSSVDDDLVIDLAGAAGDSFLNTVTVVDTLSVAEADVLFG